MVFVAHSLGGLVIKQALLLAFNSLDESHHKVLDATLGIFFFGTPHRGNISSIDRVLQYYDVSTLTGKESGPFAELSLQLGRVQVAFKEFHPRYLPNLQIISFFEEIPIPGFGLVSEKANLETLSRSDQFRLLMNSARFRLRLYFFQSVQTTT